MLKWLPTVFHPFCIVPNEICSDYSCHYHGSFAERVRFVSYLLFIVLFSLFIYTFGSHGLERETDSWLNFGIKDFAGGTVVT